jgi:hypothetical protein
MHGLMAHKPHTYGHSVQELCVLYCQTGRKYQNKHFKRNWREVKNCLHEETIFLQ